MTPPAGESKRITQRRVAAAIGLTLVLLASLGAAAAWLARRQFAAPGPLPQAADVVVPRGAAPVLAAALRTAGVIASARDFRIAVLLTHDRGPLRAGEFAFPAHASLGTVLGVLRHGRPVEHRLTIPEGLTAAQIATLVDRAPDLTGPTPVPAEGAVLPQTYAYEYGTPRAALIARATAAMRRALADVWAGRAPGTLPATPRDLLILASIVERETALPAERPHVAAVFLNRLRFGMRLQSDPTVAYAATGGLVTAQPDITLAELRLDNPYNTYRIGGLPPGPIDSPGLASLEAVAHPLASEDLYFVADGKGGHAFAATLAAHDRNVANWRAAEGHADVRSPAP
jgi:UPF0755 protein